MKNTNFSIMYTTNKVMTIATALLMLTIFLGMLAMMPVGLVQVLCAFYLLGLYNRLDFKIQRLLQIYFAGVLVVLAYFLACFIESGIIGDELVYYVLGFSGIWMIFFTYITRRCAHWEAQKYHQEIKPDTPVLEPTEL
ncbi:MAG: hypothetical protein WBA16_05285 [Nonlabens sp.]